jgi:hypothetical protein
LTCGYSIFYAVEPLIGIACNEVLHLSVLRSFDLPSVYPAFRLSVKSLCSPLCV